MAKRPDTQWLFLRGLARESQHWGALPDSFGESLQTKVTVLDMPGMGTRREEKSPVTIPAIVESLRSEWLKERSPSRPSFLMALSLGGMVALEWISRYPEDFAGAVLINTSLPKLSPLHHRMRLSALRVLLRTVLTRDAEKKERLILSVTSNRHDRYAEVGKKWAAIHRERPAAVDNILRQLSAAITWTPPAAKPATPVLLLGCDRDRLVSPECTKALQKRWGWPLESHPTAGHELPLDEPEWVIEKISTWVRSLPNDQN